MKKVFLGSALLLIFLPVLHETVRSQQNQESESVLVQKKLVTGEPFKSKIFSSKGFSELHVLTFEGNVEIYENPDSDQVKIDLYVERGFSLWSGHSNMDNYHIIIQQNGPKIVASVEPKRSDSRVWKSDNTTFSFVIEAPVNTSARIRSTSGNIWIRNLKGSHMIQATSGNLDVSGMEGETNAFSASGNIAAENNRGELNLKTINGNIGVNKAEGEVRIRTVSGNIDISDLNGTLIAATTSGDISAGILSPGEGSYAETLSGNVLLSLPPEFDYTIQATGLRVDLAQILENRSYEGSIRPRNANIVIGEGRIPVKLSSVSGEIIIKPTN